MLANVHPSWVTWWWVPAIAALFLLAAFGAFVRGDVGSASVRGFVAVASVAYAVVARSQSRYAVTNQRVTKRVGLLNRSTGEVDVADVRDVTTRQGLLERVLGNGTVEVDHAGEDSPLRVGGVSNRAELADLIRRQSGLESD